MSDHVKPASRVWSGRAAVLAIIVPGLLGAASDEAALTVALPRIAEQFDATIPQVQWVMLAYILAMASMMLPVGRIADLVGRHRVFAIGALLYGLTAFAAGSAPTLSWLVGLKAIQGVGASVILATSLAILTSSFSKGERGKAIGLYMVIGGSGFILGPLVGGSIVSWLGWRWMMYMGVPFGLISVIASLITGHGFSKQKLTAKESFDWLGAALSATSVLAFLLAMSNGNAWGWASAYTVSALVISVVLAISFLAWQRIARAPILPPDLITNMPFVRGLALTFLFILGNIPVFILLPFYIEGVLGHEAIISGLAIGVAACVFTVIGAFAGRLSDRIDWRIFVTASALLIATTMLLLSLLNERSSVAHVIGLMAMMGVGVGLWYAPTTSAALSQIDPLRQGVASSATLMVRFIANLSTVAISISIVAAVMAYQGFEASLSSIPRPNAPGAQAAFIDGMSIAFWSGATVNIFAAIVTLIPLDRFWPRRRQSRDATPEGLG